MDFTKIILVCLLVFSVVLAVKYISLKRQIRCFGRQVEQRKNINYSSPIKVDFFDKDIVALAVKLNEHTDIQRSLDVEYKRSKEQLNNVISGISHDFRTPLTASLGYLQMIEKSGGLTGKNAEYLEIALQKNTYLKELSDEFFELSKIKNGHEEMTVESVNLSNLISDLVMEQYNWMQERNISPDFHIADGIVINSNRRYIMRIVENLLSNAEKYTFTHLGISLSEDNGKIILSAFNDTENGTEIDINRVFEPFYKPSSRNKNGSGLGLYVVKCLAEKLFADVFAEFDNSGDFRITVEFIDF
ncbi:MAG: HAMP domain-containing histidine kinase [Ruminococcus sp.]|nr:HAMP domain-containing histidine kinase [Ruminococcus sp.]